MKVPDRLDSVLAEITALNDGGWFSTWYEVIYYDIDAKEWCHYLPSVDENAGSNTFNKHATVLNWKYCDEALRRETPLRNKNEAIRDSFTGRLFNGMSLILSKYPEGNACFDYDDIALEIWIKGIDNKLTNEDREILKQYLWYVEYSDKYSIWKFEG